MQESVSLSFYELTANQDTDQRDFLAWVCNALKYEYKCNEKKKQLDITNLKPLSSRPRPRGAHLRHQVFILSTLS